MLFPPLHSILVFLGFITQCVAAPTGAVLPRSSNSDGLPVPEALRNILDNTHRSTLYRYPTDFTRGIIPKKIHSHNDYWRDFPFYSALSVGAISIEADVWLVNDTLYVGHDPLALTSERTLDSLYTYPILDTLRRRNSPSKILPLPLKAGVFDADMEQTLYLFVDIKTNGQEAWPFILQSLEPLRQEQYLTRVNSQGKLVEGAITVIGTGNTPLELVRSETERDVFYDAALEALNSTASDLNNTISPVASTSFEDQIGEARRVEVAEGRGPLSPAQLETLRSQVRVAHDRSIKVRYWDLPGWPIRTRNAIWRQLYDEGVDLINADDIVSAAGFGESGQW